MNIVELIIDEESMESGIQAISVVGSPAIEIDFVALKDEKEKVQLATLDEDRRVLLGAALVPDKPIYRRNGEEEYYIYFSKDTVRKASELYLKAFNQGNATLEHEVNVEGLTVVESWIVEDTSKDKTNLYGMELPVGTWVVSMKVDNDDIWTSYVKTGKVKGFSIEGYFSDKAMSKTPKVEQSKQEDIANEKLEAIKEIIRSHYNK